MKRAILTTDYKCAPNGYQVRTFARGQIVEGDVARWAIEDGCAEIVTDPREETKVIAPAEIASEHPAEPKRRRGRPRKVDGNASE